MIARRIRHLRLEPFLPDWCTFLFICIILVSCIDHKLACAANENKIAYVSRVLTVAIAGKMLE